MSIERLSGGLTPADGSDPRTFPEIFNNVADLVEAAGSDIDTLEGKNLPAFSAVAPEDGQVPVFDAVEGVFVPGEGGAGSLEDLTDTDITTPASNEFLRYDGTDWVNTVADATTSVAGVVTGTTSDGNNTALGQQALLLNTTGDRNTAVGRQALRDNTQGGDNTALGQQALLLNTTGERNTAVGRLAMLLNTEGGDNTASGFEALRNNTTGNSNTAVGRLAMLSNTEGERNAAVGRSALQNNTTGSRNTALGRFALFNNTEGSDNTAVGRNAAALTTLGSNNTTLGNLADPSSATASNQVTLGNSNITSLRCNVTSISSLSDVRDKTDIVDTQHGLDTLNKIRPVDFTWARRDGTFGSAPDIGFIAQELASVEDETGDAHRLRLTLRDNPDKLEATPGRLIPILVKAVQELSTKNDELEARIEALEAK